MEHARAPVSPLDPRNVDDIEALEDEIATLMATLTAATHRLLCLIGEHDRRGAWADPLGPGGFRSAAHWLSWRVGLDLGTARQYVRVARALPSLPRISEAFGRGEISYSKVRAITRIAAPENEETLLGWAREGTASQVERLVRSFRRANRAEESARAVAQEEARYLQTWWDRDGMLVVRGRLAPEQGAVLLKALEVAGAELARQERDSAEPPAGDTVKGPARDSAEPLAQCAGPVTRDDSTGPGGATPSPGRWLADGLARVAERALESAAAGVGPSGADRFLVVVHVDAEVLASPEADGRCELENGPALAADAARRIACDAPLVGCFHGDAGILESGRKSRAISAPLRRALRARDGTRCAFPGCTCRARDGHHIEHWANGGPTRLENVIGLCRRHHTLVHEGGVRVEATPGGGFRFRRPDGRELPFAPPLLAAAGEPRAALLERWIPAEIALDGERLRAEWDGEPVDYGWAVDGLCLREGAAWT